MKRKKKEQGQAKFMYDDDKYAGVEQPFDKKLQSHNSWTFAILTSMKLDFEVIYFVVTEKDDMYLMTLHICLAFKWVRYYINR